MAYDEQTADRFRQAIGKRPELSERRMMGGVCFMLHGNMVGGADRNRDGVRRFMFRVGKENQAEALKLPGATVMEQGGRVMRGFLFVDEESCDDEALAAWIKLAISFVEGLPPK